MDKLKSVPETYCTFDLDKKSEDSEHQKKLASLECNRVNNDIQLTKTKQKTEQEKEEHRMADDTNVTNNRIVYNEKRQKETIKQLERGAILKFLAEHNKSKEEKLQRQKQDDVLTEACRIEQDRKQCKMKSIINESHKHHQETEQFKKHYKLIESAKENEERSYDFINKRIEENEKRLESIDKAAIEKKKEEREKCVLQSQRNKIVAQIKQMSRDELNRQCPIPQCKNPSKCCECYKNTADGQYLEFLVTNTKLSEELKKREKEQPPWISVEEAHKQLATEANKSSF